MSLGDEQKPKQNTPSGSNESNPQGGANSSGLTKADIEAAIRILDQEKQKLAAEIKKEQEKVANDKTDPFQEERESISNEYDKSQKESAETTTEELEKSYDKEASKNDTSSQSAETETQNTTTAAGQSQETQTSVQSQTVQETEAGSETNQTNSAGENSQVQGGQASQSADGESGVEASPDYADYAETGDADIDDANKLKVRSARSFAADKSAQLEKDRQENNKNRLQAREDKAKDEIFDQQWDDYQNGKTDTAPTADSINEQFTKNEAEKAQKKAEQENREINTNSPDNQQQGKQGFDAKPQTYENSRLQNQVAQNPSQNSAENPNNLAEGSNDYMPTATPGVGGESPKANDGSSDYMNYAPTGDKAVDDANQASVDRMRQQRADDEKHAAQDKEEKSTEKSKGAIDKQMMQDFRDGKRDSAPTTKEIDDQHNKNQEAKKTEPSNDKSESEAFKNKTDSLSDKQDKSKVDKKSTDSVPNGVGKPKLGARLSNIGNKLNTAKNIAEDPKEAAKQAAEQKLKEYARKAAQEAAKKAAQLAARAAQMAGSLASSVVSSIGSAILATSEIWIPIVLVVVLFVAVFSSIAIVAYCSPIPPIRGLIEYALTQDDKNLIQVAGAIPGIGAPVAAAGDAVATHSEIYKMFYGTGGICPDKNPDKCPPGSGTSGGAVSAGGAINGCFNQEILKNPTIEFIKAQGLVKYTAQTSKIKDIYDAGKSAGVPDEVIKWVVALSPTESDMSFGQYGSAEDCYGIIQFCRSSNGSCTFQNALYNVDKYHGTEQVKDLEKSIACGATASPSMSKSGAEVKGDKVLQMKMAWAGFKLKKAIIKSACKLWPGQSEIYRISAAWLGCSTRSDIGGTSPVNYGKAAENNFKLITCEATSKLEKDNLIDRILNQLAQKNVDNIPLKTAIIKQVEVSLASKNAGDKNVDQGVNILTKFLGGVDVEAEGKLSKLAGTDPGSQFLNAVAEFEGAFADKSPNIPQTNKNPGNIKGNGSSFVEKFIKQKYPSAKLSLDSKNHIIFETEEQGWDAFKEYMNQNFAGKYDPYKSAKTVGEYFQIYAPSSDGNNLSEYMQFIETKKIKLSDGTLLVRDTKTGLIVDILGGVSGLETSSSSSSSDCPPCGDSNGSGAISSATGDGTISKGGDFTPEIRAYLDVLAEEEVPKEIHLKLDSYFAGNQIPAKFTEAEAKLGHPGNVGGKGNNVGRYQFNQGDYNDAKAADSRIKDYGPEGQDLVALYKLKYRRVLEPLNAGKIEDAFEAGSAEWESVVGKNDTILTGGSPRKGQRSPTGRTMAKQVAYYNQRLAVYKGKTGSYFNFPNIVNKTLAFANFNSIDVYAEDKTLNKQLLQEIFDKYKNKNLVGITVIDTKNSQTLDINGDTNPVAPASVIKLLIASALKNNKISLDKSIKITSDMQYNDDEDEIFKTGKVFTVKKALEEMLSNSNNVSSNALISVIGLNKINNSDYPNSKITGFIKAPPNALANKTTTNDVSYALAYLIKDTEMLNYLKNSNQKFGLNSTANKWGMTNLVTGNSAYFSNGYIISAYVNSTNGGSVIKQLSEEILAKGGDKVDGDGFNLDSDTNVNSLNSDCNRSNGVGSGSGDGNLQSIIEKWAGKPGATGCKSGGTFDPYTDKNAAGLKYDSQILAGKSGLGGVACAYVVGRILEMYDPALMKKARIFPQELMAQTFCDKLEKVGAKNVGKDFSKINNFGIMCFGNGIPSDLGRRHIGVVYRDNTGKLREIDNSSSKGCPIIRESPEQAEKFFARTYSVTYYLAIN